MSTDSLRQIDADAPAGDPPGGGSAQPLPAQESPSATTSATDQTTGYEFCPLPPRIDNGGDITDVLDEVSKIFGQKPKPGETLSAMVADEINTHIVEIVATQPPPEPVLDAQPQPEMPLEDAADLFRSKVDPEPTESAAESPSSKSFEPAIGSSESTSAPAGRISDWLCRLLRLRPRVGRLIPRLSAPHLPRRAVVPLCLVIAAAMGWGAGAYLNRASGHAHPAEEKSERITTNDHAPENTTDPAGNVDDRVRQAEQQRDEAERKREQAVGALAHLEDRIRKEDQQAKAEAQRREEARRAAEEEYRRAAHQLADWRLRTYNVQLARVRDTWKINPGLALALLEDRDRCPVELRDFAWGYFFGRAKSDLGTFAVHPVAATALAWSADGKWIGSTAQDGFVRFLDLDNRGAITAAAAHPGGASAFAISIRGNRYVTAGADGAVRLWDTKTRKQIGGYFGHLGPVRALDITADGTMFVSGGDDGTVKFWNADAKAPAATRWGYSRRIGTNDSGDEPAFPVLAIACSPDGRLAASGCGQTVRVWEIDGASEKTNFTVSGGDVTALAFSADSRLLVAGTERALVCFDLKSATYDSRRMDVPGPVRGLAFSAEGGFLAAAVGDSALVIPDFGRRPFFEPLCDSFRTLRGHLGDVTGVAFSPEGLTLATSGADGTVRLWSTKAASVEKDRPDSRLELSENGVSASYSPDGKLFAAATADAVTVWNIADRVEVAVLSNRSGEIAKIAFSPNSRLLAVASKDWPIAIWDIARHRVSAALNGHTAAVNSVVWLPDGKTLVSGSEDATVRVWDAATFREKETLRTHRGPVLALGAANDGRSFATGGADGCVKIWTIGASRERANLQCAGPVTALAFSPRDQILVAAVMNASSSTAVLSPRPPLVLCDLRTGKVANRFGPLDSAIHDVAFTPDGKTLVTSDDRGVKLWDALSGDQRESLPASAPQSAMGALAISPDGLTLGSVGNRSIFFWTAARQP